MFDFSKFNMDKLVHTFIQNLGLKIESHACKKFNKITFVTNIDNLYKIKQFYPAEKIKEINMQQDMDLTVENNIKYFMEKHTSFFDKFTYLNNTQMLTSHLRSINTKILQKIRIKRKHNESMKRGEIETYNKILTCKRIRTNLANKLNGSKYNSLFSIGGKQKYINFYNCEKHKFKKVTAFEDSEPFCDDKIMSNDCRYGNILKMNNDRQENFINTVINMANKEIEMSERFLQLYINDVDHIKKNIQVTLHIGKNSKYKRDKRGELEYNQLLCHHAILCLIEPSKKGAVLIENNLSIIIQKYLSQGYKYHFDFQRSSKDHYTAVLILSQWAKVLVKHINTTMMHTICGILRCDVEEILVLYNPRRKLFETLLDNKEDL
ncbi:PREDICTED: uncharacterized protein LOC108553886 [Eufriesea mexicana]|uniref:uncharacterized protein LOC108553886 n=1 Tax=Eufriesea mexicana TaxID=516756 RepID=UPI00083BE2EA|nr:PREDICTED: uncharacterized protein LOC108553886 [Eufriesea mexicana]